VCVLFLLISRKFNTLCFLAMVATLKLSAMEAGLLPVKEQPFLFSHWRLNTRSLLKIESSNFLGG
jgi:hypothetical protein